MIVLLSFGASFLAAAPFTPAIWLSLFLLPIAVLMVWKNAILPGALAVVLCISAFWTSPYPLIHEPAILLWIAVHLIATITALRRYFVVRA